MNLAAAHLQVDSAHRDEAVEFLHQAARFDYEFIRHILRRGCHGGRADFLWPPLCGTGARLDRECPYVTFTRHFGRKAVEHCHPDFGYYERNHRSTP